MMTFREPLRPRTPMIDTSMRTAHRRRMRRQESAATGCVLAGIFLYLVYLLVVVGLVVGLFFLVWKAVLG